jgi:hypothetical protein
VTTSFISDQDFTTPAHIRIERAIDDEPPRRDPARPALAVTFLAAVWLVVGAMPFGYVEAGRYDAFWSDAVVGVTLAVVTAIRLLRPGIAAFGWVTAGLALWLPLAPLVLQYGWSATTVNDVAVGVLVLACCALNGGRAAPQ